MISWPGRATTRLADFLTTSLGSSAVTSQLSVTGFTVQASISGTVLVGSPWANGACGWGSCSASGIERRFTPCWTSGGSGLLRSVPPWCG